MEFPSTNLNFKKLPIMDRNFCCDFQSFKSISLSFRSKKLNFIKFPRTRSVSNVLSSKKVVSNVFKSTVLFCICHQRNQCSISFCQRFQFPLISQCNTFVFLSLRSIFVCFYRVALDLHFCNLNSTRVLWMISKDFPSTKLISKKIPLVENEIPTLCVRKKNSIGL